MSADAGRVGGQAHVQDMSGVCGRLSSRQSRRFVRRAGGHNGTASARILARNWGLSPFGVATWVKHPKEVSDVQGETSELEVAATRLHVDEQVEVAVDGRGVAGHRPEDAHVVDTVLDGDGLDLFAVRAQLRQPDSPPGRRIVTGHCYTPPGADAA